jgi:hypothetical protein
VKKVRVEIQKQLGIIEDTASRKSIDCLDDAVLASLAKIDAPIPISLSYKDFPDGLRNVTGTPPSLSFTMVAPASRFFWEVHSIALSPLPSGASSVRKFALVLIEEKRPVATVFQIDDGFAETKVIDLPGYIRAEAGEFVVIEPNVSLALIPWFELRGRLRS